MGDEPTHEELLEWLAELAAESEYKIESGTFTTGEWCEARGVSTKTALKAIKALMRKGFVESYKTPRPNVHGIWMRMPAWRIIDDSLRGET